MQLPSRLTALFLPTRRLADDDATVLHRGGALGPQQWVVPRARCHYRRLDLSQLPPRQREAAARVAARRHDPVADAEHCIAWNGGHAHLWIWPPGDDFRLPTDQAWLPESLLRAPPADDGARVLRQVEGYEGQIWRGGELAASRWWPQAPDPKQWVQFLRASGMAPDARARVPEPESLPWSSAPWGESRRGLPASPVVLERLGWITVGCIVALGLGWQLGTLGKWSIALMRVDVRTEALRAQATPLLEARERADLALQQLQGYHELRKGVNDYAAMADVVSPLPADARLRSWLREGMRVQSGVHSGNTDPRQYVSAFDNHPRLTDVVATPSGDGSGMELGFAVMEEPVTAPGGEP